MEPNWNPLVQIFVNAPSKIGFKTQADTGFDINGYMGAPGPPSSPGPAPGGPAPAPGAGASFLDAAGQQVPFVPGMMGGAAPAPGGAQAPGPAPGPSAGEIPFFSYNGSITVPPCAEETIWFVRKEPLWMGDSQGRALYNLIWNMTFNYGNYRSVQPIGQRKVTMVKGMQDPNPPVNLPLPNEPPEMTRREFRTKQWATDALHKAKVVADAVRWMDKGARDEASDMAAAFKDNFNDLGPWVS